MEHQRDWIEDHPYAGHAPHNDTDTSIAAANAIESVSGQLRRKVLTAITAAGDFGMTDSEIQKSLRLLTQSETARRRELVLLSAVKDSGRRRLASTGRSQIVWVKA